MDLLTELMQSPQTRTLSLIVAGQAITCLGVMAMLVKALVTMQASDTPDGRDSQITRA